MNSPADSCHLMAISLGQPLALIHSRTQFGFIVTGQALICRARRPADNRQRSPHGRENLATVARYRYRPSIFGRRSVQVPGVNHSIYLLSAPLPSSTSPGRSSHCRIDDEDSLWRVVSFEERDGLCRLTVLWHGILPFPAAHAAKRCHSTVRWPWKIRQVNHNNQV